MKNLIHYVLILDKSGSMQDIKGMAISSFNEQVDSIRKICDSYPEAEIRVTLCTFNDEVTFPAFCSEMSHLKKLTHATYQPGSMTALYDAIGTTSYKLSEQIAPNDKAFFAVFTDGLENASKEYSATDISKIIEEAQMKGWDFRFYCRYEDKLHYKTHLNIHENCISNVSLDQEGFNLMVNDMGVRFKRMVTENKKQK